MRRRNYLLLIPAVILTASEVYPPLFAVTGYFTIFIMGYCGIALGYSIFVLVYMALAAERSSNYDPRRYWFFALTNGLPFVVGLVMLRWREMI
jgi:Na+/melibiose symporter-like transporter